jgi:hypothetical protein
MELQRLTWPKPGGQAAQGEGREPTLWCRELPKNTYRSTKLSFQLFMTSSVNLSHEGLVFLCLLRPHFDESWRLALERPGLRVLPLSLGLRSFTRQKTL